MEREKETKSQEAIERERQFRTVLEPNLRWIIIIFLSLFSYQRFLSPSSSILSLSQNQFSSSSLSLSSLLELVPSTLPHSSSHFSLRLSFYGMKGGDKHNSLSSFFYKISPFYSYISFHSSLFDITSFLGTSSGIP